MRTGSDDSETPADPLVSKDRTKVGKICSINCGFPLVKQTAKKIGMTEIIDEFENWTLYWTDKFPTFERCRLMKRHQKTNHIPGILSVCRKDELAKNLNRMLKLFPKSFDFFPKTWVLPGELDGLLKYSKQNPNKTFILKPSRGSLGRGIYLTKTIEHLDLLKMMIGQVYIEKPFLIDGFKFDLRLYVLVASCNPLRVYVYNEGLGRFATRKYEPSGSNLHIKYMHLTNYSVNKNSSTFVNDEFDGSKRKLSTIYEWLLKNGYNAVKVWESIDDVIVKTILTALPDMRSSYKSCFPLHTDTVAGFELLGFDFILDHKLRPFLLEVNHTPSFTRCTQLDRDVKDPLMYDVFNLLHLSEDETSRILEDEKTFLSNRLNNKSAARNLEKERIQQLIKLREQWENEHLGNFRKVFPCENMSKYRPFLKALLQRSFEQDEFGEVSVRKLRKNPYEFIQTETDTSDGRTLRNLLLTSYNIFENLHCDMAKASEMKFFSEINEGRNNRWNSEEMYSNLYTAQKKLFAEGMKSVLKCISKRNDILAEDKEKLSSIYLDPPTFLPENRESCIDLTEYKPENPKIAKNDHRDSESHVRTKNVYKNFPVCSITAIEELDFIPGIVQETHDRFPVNAKPQYEYCSGPP